MQIIISLTNTFPSLGEYLDNVDRVMTQVDRITEDIAHMPVAAFIFRDKESDEVHYSTDNRYLIQNQTKIGKKFLSNLQGPHVTCSGKMIIGSSLRITFFH